MPTARLELIQRDREALKRAVELMRKERGVRREQIEQKLRDQPWEEAARFAAYHRQFTRLHLKPWQFAPCWIDPDDIEDILAGGDDGQQYGAALLLKRMLAAGLSRFEPDPEAALEQAKKSGEAA